MKPGWREATRAVNGIELHVVEAGDPDRPHEQRPAEFNAVLLDFLHDWTGSIRP